MGLYCARCQSRTDTSSSRCSSCGMERPSSGWPIDARLGDTVAGGQYRVLGRLGTGGFGVVYEVETVVGGLRRALKVLGREWVGHELMQERFVNEALALEHINHPNVARCYAAGTLERGELYLLMELVDGVPLARLLEDQGSRQALPPLRAVHLAKQVASGLVAAHAQGILHRDLKPDNVLVLNPGSDDERVKVLDFGIAKLTAEGSTTQNVIGTPHYMAPEQFHPGVPLDTRIDIWQLGVTLFRMVTGKHPFGEEGPKRPSGRRSGEVTDGLGPSPVEAQPDLADCPALESLIRRMLAFEPDDRPSSVAEVIEALSHVENLLSSSRTDASPPLLELICEEPSESAWWAVVRHLSDRGDDRDHRLAAAEDLLARWPDELRRAPCGWWEAAKRHDPPPVWGLARSLDLSNHGLTDEDVERIAHSELLATIRRLDLSGNGFGPRGLDALARSQHLGELRALDLSGNRVATDGLGSFAEQAAFPELVELHLADCGLERLGARTLRQALFELEVLDLSDNDLGDEDVSELVDGRMMGRLRTLVLSGNGLSRESAGAIAGSKHLRRLRVLELGRNALGDCGVELLAQPDALPELQRLGLGGNQLTIDGLEALLRSPISAELAHLDLSGNELGAEGASALGRALPTMRLASLDLGQCHIGDHGLGGLVECGGSVTVRRLAVAGNGLTADGLRRLASSRLRPESMVVSGNGRSGTRDSSSARDFVEAVGALRPRRLEARSCGLSGDAVVELLRAAGGNVRELEVAGNHVGEAGALRLSQTEELTSIRRLGLSGTAIGFPGAESLVGSWRLEQARALDLSSNELGDDGVSAVIRAAGGLSRLESLDLSDNRLTANACRGIARSSLAPRLKTLRLAHNELGDVGAERLAHDGAWRSLRELDLRHNEIGLGGAATVLGSPTMSRLSRVDLRHNAQSGLVDLHSLGDDRAALLEESFARLAAQGTKLAERFYQELFARHPGIEPLFAGVSMSRQRQHLLNALVTVIDNLRHPEEISGRLVELGRRHVGYGALPSQYFAVTGTLLDVIEEAAADQWSEELRDAWSDGLEAIAGEMMKGHFEAGPRERPSPSGPISKIRG